MDLELTDEQRWLSESVETLLVREWPGAGGDGGRRARPRRAVAGARRVRGAQRRSRRRPRRGRALPGVAGARRAPRVRAVRRQRRPAVRRRAVGGSAARGLRAARRGRRCRVHRTARARTEMGGLGRADGTRAERAPRPQGGGRARRLGRSTRRRRVRRRPARAGPPDRRCPRRRGHPAAGVRPAGADERARARRGRCAGGGRRRGSGGRRAAAATRRSPAGCSPPPRRSARLDGSWTTRAPTRPSGASSAARSAATRRCATSWRTCTSGRRACGRPSSTRPRLSTTTWTRQARPPRSRRHTSRAAAREVAHGAMQVFGGIAFTEEHPAHRFLRRIVVREQQFGDAAHHERELGRALAAAAAGSPQLAGDGRAPAVSVH